MKKFLIIGNMNVVTYKEIFPLIKENKMWLGQNTKGGTRKGNSLVFTTPNKKEKQVSSWWYTNMDCQRHKQHLDLYKTYNETDYPKYDNYDAIEVSKSCDVPMDYNGIMGVPISFLMFHCPTQFEIVGFFNNYKPETANIELGMIYGDAVNVTSTKSLFRGPVINGKAKYFRILIKNCV